jgi:hypothetical protein
MVAALVLGGRGEIALAETRVLVVIIITGRGRSGVLTSTEKAEEDSENGEA